MHIHYYQATSKITSLFWKVENFFSEKTLLGLHFVSVQSCLVYGIVVWRSTPSSSEVCVCYKIISK